MPKKLNRSEQQSLSEQLLQLEDFKPESDLPPENIEPVAEISEVELKRQKNRLFEEWSQFSGVEMPKNINPDTLLDQELIKTLYDNLMIGVDQTIKEIGFDIDQQQLEIISQEQDIGKKTELQKKFIQGILGQTRSTAEGGLFNRGKEDTWAFFPKQIMVGRRLNCSGATLMVGRILEQAGFKTEHGFAAHHAVSVVELSDGQRYYVDSRRNRNNIVALSQEERPIGDLTYRELNHPRIAYTKIIPVPSQWAEVEVIMGNYNSMRNEVKKHNSDNAAHREAARLIGEMDSEMKDIDFGLLWDKMFPEILKLHTENSDWSEEERIVDAKHNFSDQIENFVSKKFTDLNQDQRVAITNELIKNGQEILAFCQKLDYPAISGLQDKLSPDAYSVAVIIRDSLEMIRGQSQASYEFALEELKGKFNL